MTLSSTEPLPIPAPPLTRKRLPTAVTTSPQVALETLCGGWEIQGTVAQQQVVPSLPPSSEAAALHPWLSQGRAALRASQEPRD